MSQKVFCANDYKPYSVNEPSYFSVYKKNISLIPEFIDKIQQFQAEKLNHLSSDLREAVFYDETVYTGSAGSALYYFSQSLKCNLKQKDKFEYKLKALDYFKLDNLKGRRITFLCGDAGPLAIAAVISYEMREKRHPENLPDYDILVRRLMSLISSLAHSPDELLYGKSGYLYALLFVNKHTNKETIPKKHIQEVVNAIIESGKLFSRQTQAEAPLFYEWHDKVYLGAAHGIAGILFMLLQAREFISESDLKKLIKPTLDWLLAQRYSSGNFPSSLGSKSGDKLVQWCHGAPGFVPLCILASEVFQEEKDNYMKIALDCGEVVWQRGLCSKGYSICHGVSGNAYAFLQLYQATKDPKHYYRACCFMDWCIEERPAKQSHIPDRPASLFEGVVGRLYLAQDIFTPTDAKFPAMCL